MELNLFYYNNFWLEICVMWEHDVYKKCVFSGNAFFSGTIEKKYKESRNPKCKLNFGRSVMVQ